MDHAIGGAAFLCGKCGRKAAFHAAVEAIYGHHSGLVAFSQLEPDLQASLRGPHICLSGKEASLAGKMEYAEAIRAFTHDFPDFALPELPDVPPGGAVENMIFLLPFVLVLFAPAGGA